MSESLLGMWRVTSEEAPNTHGMLGSGNVLTQALAHLGIRTPMVIWRSFGRTVG